MSAPGDPAPAMAGNLLQPCTALHGGLQCLPCTARVGLRMQPHRGAQVQVCAPVCRLQCMLM